MYIPHGMKNMQAYRDSKSSKWKNVYCQFKKVNKYTLFFLALTVEYGRRCKTDTLTNELLNFSPYTLIAILQQDTPSNF